MKNFDNKFIENQIFGDTIRNIISREDLKESDDSFEVNDNIEITNTNIVCNGKGFKNILQEKVDNENPDFSTYLFNNFKIIDNNEILNELEDKGLAIVLTSEGELSLRISIDAEFKSVTEEKASKVVSNILGKPVMIGKGTKNRPPDIQIKDLMLVSESTFEPTIMSEFYKDGNTYKHNKFKPSKYLMARKNRPYKKPTTIMKLIAHLVNYDEKRFHYIMNWLSYMFISLTKAQVAVVLRGVQGSGKGIFFLIISMLFGKEFCFTVGNKTLKSQFLGSVFENKLFININEMSHDIKSNKENKNSLKELVTDSEFAGEKKYENISKPIKLAAQILITSNEAYILEIEPEDRRYTVLSTAGNISSDECNFFGFGDFKVFKKQIESELMDFAIYLKNYPLDTKLANKALNTPEKKALIKGTNDRFKLFVNILLNKDISSLEALKANDSLVYSNIISGFKKNRVYQKDIFPAYSILNPNDLNMSTQSLLDKLEIYEPNKFSRELRKKSGDLYFNL